MRLVLPRLVGTREAADRLIDAHAHELAGSTVEVLGTELRTGTESFADQLVFRTLVNGKAEKLLLRDSPQEFAGYVRTAAAAHGVSDLVQDLVSH